MNANNLKNANHAKADEKKSKWIVERGSAAVKVYRTPHGDLSYYTIS